MKNGFCDLYYPFVRYLTDALGKDATIILHESTKRKINFSVFWQKTSAWISVTPEKMSVNCTRESMTSVLYDRNRAISGHKLKKLFMDFPEWKKLPLAFCMETSFSNTLSCLIFSNGETNLKELMNCNPEYNLKILSNGNEACAVIAGTNYKEVLSGDTA